MAAEASASCKSKTQKAFTESNDDASAHHHQHQKKRERITVEEKDVMDQSGSMSNTTCAKINEIFGNDEVVAVRRPNKRQKKYRSLHSIYKATMPTISFVEADQTRIINANPQQNPS